MQLYDDGSRLSMQLYDDDTLYLTIIHCCLLFSAIVYNNVNKHYP